jgi:hypothetical protein
LGWAGTAGFGVVASGFLGASAENAIDAVNIASKSGFISQSYPLEYWLSRVSTEQSGEIVQTDRR